MMNNKDQNITIEDAESALKMVQDAKGETIKGFRPSTAVIMLAALLFGLETVAAGFSRGDSLWSFITIVATVLFVVVMTVWYFSMRQQGKKLRIKPNGLRGYLFVLVQFILIAGILVGGMEMYQSGTTWAPIVAGIINALIVCISLYHFPTSEFSKMEVVDE